MRDAYHEALDALNESLVGMTHLVGNAIGQATTALLDADLGLAESVIAGDQVVDKVYRQIEEHAFELLARQQPVATDLRMLVTSLRMVADLERSGDYALHIAKLARRRHPSRAVPKEFRSTILEMGAVARRIMAKTGDVVASRDIHLAAELESDDDAMDELHRRLFRLILDHNCGLEAAIDITLAGRHYERFADHAVSVARRVVYLVTGVRVATQAD